MSKILKIPNPYKKLGNGSFGCIISPNIKCKNEIFLSEKTSDSRNKVGKLFYFHEDFTRELNMGKMISKIEDAEKYFILPISYCENITINNTIMEQCKVIETKSVREFTSKEKELFEKNRNDTEVDQITMLYAGIDTEQYISTLPDYKIPLLVWVKLLENVFNGVSKLDTQNICHCDIKHDNIMYMDNTLKLIDFGLSTQYDQLYPIDGYGYRVIWPIEFYLYDIIGESAFNYNYTSHANKKIQLYNTELCRFTSSRYKYYHSEEQTYADTPAIAELKREVLIQSANKIDVYSIGITCIMLHHLISMDDVEHRVQEYKNLIKNMSEFNYTKRICITDALNKCKEIINL